LFCGQSVNGHINAQHEDEGKNQMDGQDGPATPKARQKSHHMRTRPVAIPNKTNDARPDSEKNTGHIPIANSQPIDLPATKVGLWLKGEVSITVLHDNHLLLTVLLYSLGLNLMSWN